jgi:hypothetical protein
MPANIGEVSWRPEHHPSNPHPPPEFIVPVDPSAYHQWQKDPSATPLVSVVDSFDIFINRAGSRSGQWDRPSKQQLNDAFGGGSETEAIEAVLRKGQLRPMSHGNELIPRDRMFRI